MQAAGGSIEQACATCGRAIDHMDGVPYGRTRKAVGDMRTDLVRFRARGLRCTTDLDERSRDFPGDRRQPGCRIEKARTVQAVRALLTAP